MAKNFKITAKEDGKEYWISRAVAVVGIIVGVENGNISSFLISQRGPGCPDFVGSWSCTCGYLDWDETAEEGVVREIYEELGIKINTKPILWKVITDPKRDSRQNIILRYLIPVDQKELDEMVSNIKFGQEESRGGENSEVSGVKLVSVVNIRDYNWAFNHDDVILEAYDEWRKITYGKLTENLVDIIDNKL